MKNYQKNAIFPSVLVSCMKNQLIHAEYEKTHYGISKRLNLEMHLNLWFKWTSNQMFTSCISSNSITSTCHVHASYCCIWLCIDCWHRSFSIGPAPETFQSTCLWSSASLVDLPGKQPPLFISIKPYSLAPALSYCIRTTTIHLLLCAAVVEPIPLHDLSLPQ